MNRQRMYRPLFALLLVALLGVWPLAARAQVCDVPLIVQQGTVPPNVLWILDNSGSMNEHIYHPDYDASIAWDGRFDRFSTYSVGADGERTPNDWNWNWENEPAVMLTRSINGQWGRYGGNYLNWLYWHATPEQIATVPTATRIAVGQAAVKSIMAQSSGLRHGLMIFNDNEFGNLRASVGTSIATLNGIIDGIAATTWTPSAETLYTALKYFQRNDATAPIQYECQRNFIIFVTDGLPTQDINPILQTFGDQDGDGNDPGNCTSIGMPGNDDQNCSDYMDDMAYYLAHNDMRPDLSGTQVVSTYTIGFGVDAPLLWQTAENGDGLYRVAWDLESLVQELGTVVGDIVNRISSGAAVAVVSTEAGTNNHLYRGKFMPGMWRGFLEAFELPYAAGEASVWEAGQLLSERAPGDRTIFTSIDGQELNFATQNANTLMPWLGAADEAEAANLIEYVRGASIEGYRERNGWKLGDLVYSTPVVVGPPAQFILDADYQSFLQAHSGRPHVLYVGANDGMLHAFNAISGVEMWGYVPQSCLPKLSALTVPDYCHQAYVDLSPVAYDVNVNGIWKTVLFGGQRTGGNAYFAIDITNPFAPELMWEISLPEITTSFTEPTIVRSQLGPLLWSGSGPNTAGEAYAAVVNVETGNKLSAPLMSVSAETNMLGAATSFDYDYDGFADFVYQGDLAGNLWRFDIRDGGGAWSYDKIFDGTEPIQARPALTIDEAGGIRVYFGTGRFLQSTDTQDVTQQRFYCIIDGGVDNAATLVPGDLVNQTGVIHEVAGTDGWFIDLVQAAGERVTEPATIVEGVVYFSSFAPNDEPCSAGGRSWLYSLDYRNGAKPTEDGEGDETDDRVISLGDGVASKPVINLADESLIVQTSDARLNVETLTLRPQTILVRSWREQFQDTQPVADPPQQ